MFVARSNKQQQTFNVNEKREKEKSKHKILSFILSIFFFLLLSYLKHKLRAYSLWLRFYFPFYLIIIRLSVPPSCCLFVCKPKLNSFIVIFNFKIFFSYFTEQKSLLPHNFVYFFHSMKHWTFFEWHFH